jgi:hypothetical protein
MRAKREKHLPFFALKAAIEKKECPICYLAEQSVKKEIEDLLYEKVNDVGVARKLNESLGFCRNHSRQIAATGEALGIAIIYKRLIDRLVKHLKKSLNPMKVKGCPSHMTYAETEKRYLHLLSEHWDDLKDAFDKGALLCIPHFYKALSEFKRKTEAQELRGFQARNLMALSEELEEFSRKHDYRYRDEPWGKEKDSWKRALKYIININEDD